MPMGLDPKAVDKLVTEPADCVGSISYSDPGLVSPVIKTLPTATSTPAAPVAPVQVSSTRPSLALMRDTVLLPKFGTHRSAPSDSTNTGKVPTVVRLRLFA